jgi:hypothetical protein
MEDEDSLLAGFLRRAYLTVDFIFSNCTSFCTI